MTTATRTTFEGVTSLFQSAIDTVRTLSPETQDEIARAMLDWAQHDDPSADLDADLLASLAEADRGEFASEEEVRALWAKFGL